MDRTAGFRIFFYFCLCRLPFGHGSSLLSVTHKLEMEDSLGKENPNMTKMEVIENIQDYVESKLLARCVLRDVHN